MSKTWSNGSSAESLTSGVVTRGSICIRCFLSFRYDVLMIGHAAIDAGCGVWPRVMMATQLNTSLPPTTYLKLYWALNQNVH